MRKGMQNSRQIFQCYNCKSYWTNDTQYNVGLDQICICGSRHVVRYPGIKNSKQGFRCEGCKRRWWVPIQDLLDVLKNRKDISSLKKHLESLIISP